MINGHLEKSKTLKESAIEYILKPNGDEITEEMLKNINENSFQESSRQRWEKHYKGVNMGL